MGKFFSLQNFICVYVYIMKDEGDQTTVDSCNIYEYD